MAQLALDDLDRILESVAKRAREAAAVVASRIWHAAQLLVDNPVMGNTGRVPGTRELCVRGTPYMIAYRLRGDSIEIIRILNTSKRDRKILAKSS